MIGNTSTLIEFQQSHVNTATRNTQKSYTIKWIQIILAHGSRVIDFLRCFLKSDYVSFPNVGLKRIIDSYYIILQRGEIKGIAVEQISVKDMFEEMALLIRYFVFGEAKTTTALTKVETEQQQVNSLIQKMERAHIMFNYAVVASVNGNSISHMNQFLEEEFSACIRFHTASEMKDMVGFNNFTNINMPRWTRGHYDVSKGTLLHADPLTVSVATTAIGMAVVDSTVSTVETIATMPVEAIDVEPICNISPKTCALLSTPITEDGFPSITSVSNMTGPILKDWLKKSGVTAPSDDCRVESLKELLRSHIILSQHHGLLITSSIPTDEDKKVWGMKVCSSHTILSTSNWESCITETTITPGLSKSRIDEYCQKMNVSSARVLHISETRFSDHAQIYIESSKRVTVGGFTYVPVYASIAVARSSTEEDRIVLILLLVNQTTNKTETVTSCICLPPLGLLDLNGNVANLKLAATYKPCRSADGRCSHCITALKFLSEGGKNHSTTREQMYWMRKSNKARDNVKRYDKTM